MANEDGNPPAGDAKVLPFLIKAPPPMPPLPLFKDGDKLALYPLGNGEDVIMGRAVFALILNMLEFPDWAPPEERMKLVGLLKNGYSAPWVPPR